ncbi:MAG TPA: urease accessory protein UreE [Candidatus Copromorpha excrementigallinarum]|uniref:Urease accessory protein UreE n=1 Tax=Candidatus Allocopromorpha excrementigallinarum TaxID=2840742 RepID=A0A9D1I0R9_9FIRM|nr:urease accessory protein UreE [Candidatus Copromorpha excrementigallinarum]
MIIEKIAGRADQLDEGIAVERVFLDHESLNRPHQKLVTENGEKIAVSLDHGERLFCGAVLYRDGKRAVVVDMPEEDVLEIRPEGNRQWAKAAFNIGNMHHPAYIYDDCILIPYDGILESLMKAIGVPFKRCRKKLDGERAAHTVGGHHHHHHHDGER